MTLVFGWWDWNAEASSLDNRVTGERVVYRGPAEVDDPSSSGFWLRFDYVHPELTFPLLVEETVPPEESEEEGTLWRLDYGRSSKLWRKESNSSSTYPDYGVWRRVDDCVVDAFAFWPETKTAKLARNFSVDGGWLNGEWNALLRRSMRRGSSRERTQSPNSEFSSWIIPLDSSAPSPFVFHDYNLSSNRTENWEIENPVLLEGLEFENPERRIWPNLPPHTPLTGLEGRTAYLLSVDGERLLYPYYGDTEDPGTSGHWSPRLSLLYVDSRIVCSVSGHPYGRTDQGAHWFLDLSSNCSVRTGNDNTGFFVERPYGAMPVESRALSLETQWGLIDGWSNWGGSKAYSPEWLHGLDLVQTDGLRVAFIYQGGRRSVSSVSCEIQDSF